MDPGLALYDVGTMEERVERSITNERLIASLSGTLSVVATLLSIVGLYGVMAYSVTRRTREIGIRLALGAFRSRVARGVLREASVLVALGLVIGYGSSVWLGRYLESQLYGVSRDRRLDGGGRGRAADRGGGRGRGPSGAPRRADRADGGASPGVGLQ